MARGPLDRSAPGDSRIGAHRIRSGGTPLFYEVASESGHALYALLYPWDDARRETVTLKDLAPYAGDGQRFHAHPFLGPDRDWMVFTEAVDGVPQVFSLDVSDLSRHDDIG